MSPPEDRDARRLKTPPVGVKEQLAGPIAKSRAVTPIDGIEVDREPTGVQQMPRPDKETATETLLRRSAQTKNNTLDLQSGLEALREDHIELKGKVTNVESKVSNVETKVDISIEQNTRMLNMLMGVKEKRELSDIEEQAKNNEALRIERAKNNEALRSFLIKLGAIALTLAGIAVAAIAAAASVKGG